jgi:hypothetical protein
MQPAPRRTSCPLLRLPPELRLEIYEKLFKVYKGQICLTPADGVWHKVDSSLLRKTRVPGKCVALLATCRKIHTEARPVLFANIPFVLNCCPIQPIALQSRPVALLGVITNVHKIHLHIDLPGSKSLIAEEIRAIVVPAIRAVNSATSAKELRISLDIHGLRDQEYLDRPMLCLRDIESNTRLSVLLNTSSKPLHETGPHLDYSSFTMLLKRLLR